MNFKTKLIFFVDVQGDFSVGLPDFSSKITIEDDGVYDTKESVEELRKFINEFYGNEGRTLTELEYLQEIKNEVNLEIGLIEDSLKEVNSENNMDNEEFEKSLNKAFVNSRKDLANLKRRITRLEKAYNKMKIWHPSYSQTLP